MFYPAEMSKVTIGVHNSYDTRMVRDLHDTGVLEIISIRDEKSSISERVRWKDLPKTQPSPGAVRGIAVIMP